MLISTVSLESDITHCGSDGCKMSFQVIAKMQVSILHMANLSINKNAEHGE